MFDNAVMGAPGQPPHVRNWQTILNEHWPTTPAAYRRRDPGIPVTARIVWEDDGEVWIDGTATRWDADHVYVDMVGRFDQRMMTHGAWLRSTDVKRR